MIGPRTLTGAAFTLLSSCCLLRTTGAATAVVRDAAGPVLALLTVALPLFTFCFWAALRLVNAFLTTSNRFKV
jgi:hypothetical protein